MRARKPKDIAKTLNQKGFLEVSGKNKSHHKYYYLYVNGLKTHIYTYLSHGSSKVDYGTRLMNEIKKQLKFAESKKAEDFLDCPMDEKQYVEMLIGLGELQPDIVQKE